MCNSSKRFCRSHHVLFTAGDGPPPHESWSRCGCLDNDPKAQKKLGDATLGLCARCGRTRRSSVTHQSDRHQNFLLAPHFAQMWVKDHALTRSCQDIARVDESKKRAKIRKKCALSMIGKHLAITHHSYSRTIVVETIAIFVENLWGNHKDSIQIHIVNRFFTHDTDTLVVPIHPKCKIDHSDAV